MAKQYSNLVMRGVRQNLGLDSEDTSRDAEIMEMDGEEIVARWLEWEGILGYASLKLVEIEQATLFTRHRTGIKLNGSPSSQK